MARWAKAVALQGTAREAEANTLKKRKSFETTGPSRKAFLTALHRR